MFCQICFLLIIKIQEIIDIKLFWGKKTTAEG
jgi:hypothetical protein